MVSGKRLSDDELAALGVKRIIYNGTEMYEIPCVICGKKTRSYTFDSMRTYKCLTCYSSVMKKHEKKRRLEKRKHEEILAEKLEVDLTRFRRFEKAVSYFGVEYFYAIEQAQEAMEKFDSVPEVVACIELLHIGVRVIPHQCVGNYTVDFCLPDEKAVLEIDGILYHSNYYREHSRDIALQNMLGDGWVIKHIPADAVMKNHKAFGKLMRKFVDDRRFELRTK